MKRLHPLPPAPLWPIFLTGIFLIIAVAGLVYYVFYLNEQFARVFTATPQPQISKEANASQKAETAKSVSFHVVGEMIANLGNHQEKKNYVIKDEREWQVLWVTTTSNTDPKPALPPVDFASEMIIAAFAGTKSSSGYEINITKIEETATKLQVYMEQISPGKSCDTSSVITYPQSIVKLAKVDKEVLYKVAQKVRECEGN